MKRLIDANALIAELSAGCMPIYEKGISGLMGDNSTIKDYIDSAPTEIISTSGEQNGQNLTRPSIVPRDRDWYIGEPKIEDLSDGLLDLIVNGDTLNGVRKDTLIGLVRQLYARCYQLENSKNNSKPIIDVCCGSKMFWFDKNNPNVEFCDIREIKRFEFYPQRYIEIKPDTICDFTRLPFADGSYKLAVFDPPHLFHSGEDSLMTLKYGLLKGDWRATLKKGFEECFRVLENDGVLIFKWSETDVALKEILELAPQKPLFGNRCGKNLNTHWLCFMKGR